MRGFLHRTGLLRVVVLLAAAGAAGAARCAPTEDAQAAVWEARELTLDYAGFTTHYSCEGLRDKVEQALGALGARPGLSVTPYGCSQAGRPEPFPSVRIKAQTLRGAAADTAGAIQARWKTVRLAGADRLQAGDCELADQIRREVLPLFATRNLQARTDCIPHQQVVGNIVLTVDVLVPADK